MTAGDSILLQLFILLLLILLNAFFASSEIAIISVNDNKLKKMAEEGNKRAKLLIKLTSEPSRFFATIQVGVTLAGLLASAVAADSFSNIVADFLSFIGIPKFIVYGLSVVTITLILSYFTLVLGELVPKRLALKKPEAIALSAAGPLKFLSILMRPFIALLALSTNAIVALFGIDPNDNIEKVTEEEIRMLVDEGEEEGAIEKSERHMINNIFEFDDREVSEVMTHRTELTAVEKNDSIDELISMAIQDGHSRIPVYDEVLDNIIGIIYVKDLLKYVGVAVPEDFSLSNIMRPVYFVPEAKRCDELFAELTEKKLQMAVVVDEYGGTAGIVTMEDLLESIVGNIQDEYDHEQEEFFKLDENTFSIDATTSLDEVEKLLSISFPECEYDTLGGYIYQMLGKIPATGETVQVGDVDFTVSSVDNRRIQTITAVKKQTEESDGDED